MQRDENAARNLFAYREELGNAGVKPKTRKETGGPGMVATPAPVPVDELRILKQQSVSHFALC